MGRLTVIALQIEGEAAAISAAIEPVPSELGKVLGGTGFQPVASPAIEAPSPLIPLPLRSGLAAETRVGAEKSARFGR
jgi:hypothetical protein